MYKLVAAILVGNGVGGRMVTARHYNSLCCIPFLYIAIVVHLSGAIHCLDRI